MRTPFYAFVVVVGLGLSSSACVRPSSLFVPPAGGSCAPTTPSSLRVVTWNIRAGLSSSIEQLGDELAVLEPDVVALQEVDVDADRSGDVNQPAALAERLEMDWTFAAARAEGRGSFGVALLSRLPIVEAARIELPSDNAFEPRVAVDAHVCAGDLRVRLASVHADIYPWSARQNADFLAATLQESAGEGVVVGGDLNETPDGGGPAAFVARGFTDASADAPTFADRRIDYVFVDDALAQVEQSFVAQSDASDHRPLVVDVAPPR
jgi:endonuclease/exonuclease/phosphatase family metal-dependent hydrolase